MVVPVCPAESAPLCERTSAPLSIVVICVLPVVTSVPEEPARTATVSTLPEPRTVASFARTSTVRISDPFSAVRVTLSALISTVSALPVNDSTLPGAAATRCLAGVSPGSRIPLPPRMIMRPSTVQPERSTSAAPNPSARMRSPLMTAPDRSVPAVFTTALPSITPFAAPDG